MFDRVHFINDNISFNMMRILFISTFLLYTFSHVHSQVPEFSERLDLLSPITGFANYADCMVDMNGDYLDDVVRIGGKGVFIDYQQPDGTFRQQAFNFAVQTPPTWSICAGDLDNNGYNDLLFASSASVSFILSNLSGTDYTEFLMPGFIECQRSTIHDINNDGWLDGFVCNESGRSANYRNAGNGIMVFDSLLIETSSLPGNYAAIWTDYDNDRDVDVYISKCLAGALPGDPVRTNLLYSNNADDTYTEVASEAGLADNSQSWSTVFEDFDHDGDMDAFIVNHDFQNRLMRNNGDGTFTEVTQDSGIDAFDLGAFENFAGDFNNDGHMDIYSELLKRFYLGNGDLTFIPADGPVTPGAFGDLNDDGFLDIVYDNRVFLNDGNANHWLKVNLRGFASNRNGIGTRIELFTAGEIYLREVRSGQSFSPMNSLTAHFGLGSHNQVDSMILYWPSGMITRSYNLSTDTTYLIPESPCILSSIDLPVDPLVRICPGDSFSIAAPQGYVSYFWSTGDTSIDVSLSLPGTYYVVMKDSLGCAAVSNVFGIELYEETTPIISVHGDIPFCAGDSVILSASGNDNYTWSTGDTSSTIVVSASDIYTVSSLSQCQFEMLISEPVQINSFFVPPPVVSDVFLMPGDSVMLTATGENLHWYDQPVGGNLLHVGPAFQTGVLNASSTYYVESHGSFGGQVQSGGKPDTTGQGGYPTQSGGLLFTAFEPFTLVSVNVYLPEGGAQGLRFIRLLSGDSIVALKSFNVVTGWNVLELNFDVAVGQYVLDCPQGNLFRNAGDLQYPYAIGDVGIITGSTHGDAYYYHFYDWQIRKREITCISERVPLQVIITSIASPENLSWIVYPNPAIHTLTIRADREISKASIRIFDSLGKLMFEDLWKNAEMFSIPIGKLPAGHYILQMMTGSGMYSAGFNVQGP